MKNNNDNNNKIMAKRGELFGEEFLNLKSKINLSKNNIYAEGECRIFKIVLKNILRIMNINVNSAKILSFLQHIYAPQNHIFFFDVHPFLPLLADEQQDQECPNRFF